MGYEIIILYTLPAGNGMQPLHEYYFYESIVYSACVTDKYFFVYEMQWKIPLSLNGEIPFEIFLYTTTFHLVLKFF